MTRLCFLVLVSVVACGTGTNALPSFEDSFLGLEESLLHFDDSFGKQVPLVRALQSQRVPLPLLRALISRDVIQHGMAEAGILPAIIASRHQPHLLVRDLMLFQHMIKEIGKSVLQEAIKKKDEHRVFTFAAPMAVSRPLEYLGERGTLKGFLVDLINAVCEAAGKRCVVQQTEMTNCFTHQRGERLVAGKGLLAKQFDMCMTWFKTDERAILVSFSKPYWRLNDLAFFIVKKGNPDKFDPRNITGEQLGFLFGHSSSPVCLRTSRNVIGAEDFPDQKAVFFMHRSGLNPNIMISSR
ncbi:uncharacterized protein [Ptychodera flava]|uniref:uncharacterized protein n=1 Tax=Ptychodera flava TaxID=63121 RepID=UPI00396A5DF9